MTWPPVACHAGLAAALSVAAARKIDPSPPARPVSSESQKISAMDARAADLFHVKSSSIIYVKSHGMVYVKTSAVIS